MSEKDEEREEIQLKSDGPIGYPTERPKSKLEVTEREEIKIEMPAEGIWAGVTTPDQLLHIEDGKLELSGGHGPALRFQTNEPYTLHVSVSNLEVARIAGNGEIVIRDGLPEEAYKSAIRVLMEKMRNE